MSETSVSDQSNNPQTREKTDDVSPEAVQERDDGHSSISKVSLETQYKPTSQDTSGKEKNPSNPNATNTENSNPDSAALKEEGEQPKLNDQQLPVTSNLSTNLSASSELAPKIIAGTANIRCTTPVVVGARVVTATMSKLTPGVQVPGATSLALVPQSGKVSVSSVAMNQPRVSTLTPGMTLSRISTPSQNVTVTRTPVPLQLPANFQVPQGKFYVLDTSVRNLDLGTLLYESIALILNR